jgi:hypothetical protein
MRGLPASAGKPKEGFPRHAQALQLVGQAFSLPCICVILSACALSLTPLRQNLGPESAHLRVSVSAIDGTMSTPVVML